MNGISSEYLICLDILDLQSDVLDRTGARFGRDVRSTMGEREPQNENDVQDDGQDQHALKGGLSVLVA